MFQMRIKSKEICKFAKECLEYVYTYTLSQYAILLLFKMFTVNASRMIEITKLGGSLCLWDTVAFLAEWPEFDP
jgi:hypothetical protein